MDTVEIVFTSEDLFEKWLMENSLTWESFASVHHFTVEEVHRYIAQKKLFEMCFMAHIEEMRKEKLTFECPIQAEDYTKLSHLAMMAGCSIEELVATRIKNLGTA